MLLFHNAGIAVPYIIFNMKLIQPNDDHINFENQERKYDAKVGIPTANFREMIASLAQKLTGTSILCIPFAFLIQFVASILLYSSCLLLFSMY